MITTSATCDVCGNPVEGKVTPAWGNIKERTSYNKFGIDYSCGNHYSLKEVCNPCIHKIKDFIEELKTTK